MARLMLVLLAGLVSVGGCSGRKSSLLLERQARGPMAEEPTIAKPARLRLEPVLQQQTKDGIKVTVNHASQAYLTNFFKNRELFGQHAGQSPYVQEHLVFYVKIENASDKKIYLNPGGFVVVDDLGNQYSTMGVDYVTAFAEFRRPTSTTTRAVLEGASPGFYGLSPPLGKLFVHKPQGQFAQLQQTALQPGYLFPSVVYDGLLAFWSPATKATQLRLILADIKTDFNSEELPKGDLDFTFEFQAVRE